MGAAGAPAPPTATVSDLLLKASMMAKMSQIGSHIPHVRSVRIACNACMPPPPLSPLDTATAIAVAGLGINGSVGVKWVVHR